MRALRGALGVPSTVSILAHDPSSTQYRQKGPRMEWSAVCPAGKLTLDGRCDGN
jgi:hypothetical protein